MQTMYLCILPHGREIINGKGKKRENQDEWHGGGSGSSSSNRRICMYVSTKEVKKEK